MTTPYEEGDPESKICILGEAPARTEMRLDRPLIGPSGQLLEQCMHTAGMVRRECYLLNVWEIEVIKRKDGTVVDHDGNILSGKKGITEIGVEKAAGAYRRLRECKANVVVPLGGLALDFLYGDLRIMKWRGSILTSSIDIGKKIIPTIHPAAALRGQYLWRHLIISDLDRVKKESKYPEKRLPEYTLLVDPTFDEVMSYLVECAILNRVGFDIECLNHQVSCLSFAQSASLSMSIPFVGKDGGHRWTLEEEEAIWCLISMILQNPDITTVGHNLIFDISFLFQKNHILTRGPICDTMIAHHIIWPDFLKALDFCQSMHTREPYYKDDGKIWSKPWADPIVFWNYSARDSIVPLVLWDAIEPELDNGFRQTYNDTIDMFPDLLYMGERGMKVDGKNLELTKIDIEGKIEAKRAELTEVVGFELNPLSPKQCQEYFYVTKGLAPYVSRQTGRPTTDDKALSRIFRRHRLPEAKLCQEIRAYEKLHGTYLEVGIDDDDRVHSSWNPRGTNTGRLSSSQTITGSGLNFQNLHSEFKGFLIADD